MATTEEGAARRFRALALPLLDDMHRLARALARDRTAAEDLVQETYLRALRYFDTHQGEDMRAWLAAIMRNAHRDRARQPGAAFADDAAECPDPAPSPEQQALARDQARRLRHLVAALPETLREALVLREFGGLSYAEISTALAVPAGTVMSRLARAREALRAAWLAAHEGPRS
ncbi:MAG TPA: sigma-70 family RNA polymerase sigma factor [Acetobacteraceae bacterium]|nr:sigma-70 family RNA polymerase sigma factor [Acetobacteraceae bacterium]